MTRESGFKRRVRDRMARTGESYTTARGHLHAAGEAVLHVTNGDSAAAGLHEAGLGGRVIAWRDVLHDGPVPAGRTDAALRRVRARHLAARFGQATAARTEADLRARDRELAGAGGPLVLWFEADVYDQLQLVQVLDALRRRAVDPARISLVSIGEHRGIARFGGLGELGPDQLAALAPDAVALDTEALDLAARAWAAFTAPEPDGLAAIAAARSPELRFLGEAFARVEQEHPSRSDGLSLTERRILLAVEAGGAVRDAFRRTWQAERRPFLGDTVFLAIARDLAAAAVALLSIEGDRAALTAAGRDVLAGRRDHADGGLDRWVGGVHVAGRAPRWRYDDRLERLVDTAPAQPEAQRPA